MAIFKIQNKNLISIKEKKWPSEKHLQKLTEENLEAVFPGLQLVATEFPVENFRIDTLAFDKETSSFVIIEYKRGRSFSVIDQGYFYLSLMLRHKADFILEYNVKTKSSLGRKDVDWTQSRILFLAQSYTTYQQSAIHFDDIPFELWEVNLYDNCTVLYKQLLSPDAKGSIRTIKGNETVETVSKEVKPYTLQSHLKDKSETLKTLFLNMRERILELGTIEERVKKEYISYLTGATFVFIFLQKKAIRIRFSTQRDNFNDPKKFLRDLPESWVSFKTEISLEKEEDLPYVFNLIEQSYQHMKR